MHARAPPRGAAHATLVSRPRSAPPATSTPSHTGVDTHSTASGRRATVAAAAASSAPDAPPPGGRRDGKKRAARMAGSFRVTAPDKWATKAPDWMRLDADAIARQREELEIAQLESTATRSDARGPAARSAAVARARAAKSGHAALARASAAAQAAREAIFVPTPRREADGRPDFGARADPATPQWWGVELPQKEGGGARAASTVAKWLQGAEKRLGSLKGEGRGGWRCVFPHTRAHKKSQPTHLLPPHTTGGARRTIETAVFKKKVRAWSFTAGKMGTRTVAYRSGTVVFFRAIMDQALGEYISKAIINMKTYDEKVSIEIGRVCGYTHREGAATSFDKDQVPLPLPDEDLAAAREWEVTPEVWDRATVWEMENPGLPLPPLPDAAAKDASPPPPVPAAGTASWLRDDYDDGSVDASFGARVAAAAQTASVAAAAAAAAGWNVAPPPGAGAAAWGTSGGGGGRGTGYGADWDSGDGDGYSRDARAGGRGGRGRGAAYAPRGGGRGRGSVSRAGGSSWTEGGGGGGSGWAVGGAEEPALAWDDDDFSDFTAAAAPAHPADADTLAVSGLWSVGEDDAGAGVGGWDAGGAAVRDFYEAGTDDDAGWAAGGEDDAAAPWSDDGEDGDDPAAAWYAEVGE